LAVIGYYSTTAYRPGLDDAAEMYGVGKRACPVPALETIRTDASVQQQDMTSFVLGAAMERARAVIAEDRLPRLTPHEVNQLERSLDAESVVNTQLRAFIQRIGVNREAATG
jgi:uncharacterized protein (DUF1778 family)